ncbi:12878_t:CDS:2 [Dentiscutata erythropus]|uniref:12878_t:CDS:1 n=1 Tax=Dentiscutata erythropus TaxID=1348616 RepID=A0A9N9B977_9GLOM|nr:12878_t:CDS:2 [Dentiscutata erythropus]
MEKSTIQSYNKFGTFQMPYYIPHLIIPDFDYIHFEKTALANPHSLYQMNLIQGQLEIMPPSPVHTETEFDIIGQLYNWVFANRNLVGKAGGSQRCYTLPNTIDDPKPTILGPDTSVNALSNADRHIAFLPVVSNFIVELCPQSQLFQDFHKKMLLWINGGVEILDTKAKKEPCGNLEKWFQPKSYDMKTITNSDNISFEVSELERDNKNDKVDISQIVEQDLMQELSQNTFSIEIYSKIR